MEIPDAEANAYLLLRVSSIDLEMARQTGELLLATQDLAVRHALLRDMVVSYSRPFSGNRRKDGSENRLSMRRYVPKASRPLHLELYGLRRQVFAHTDLTFLRPQLSRWPRNGERPSYPMSFSVPSYDGLLARVPEIHRLVATVERTVNAEIAEHEDRFERLYGLAIATDD